ncbi:response regulator transcription factor [Pseudoduganella aquatica]|uniref:response regulator transcription factor n=1 Tax=Pseudoduganella aquatica TaxID=2660641 RepID=UPI001E4E98A7|nr:response regulator transcription factor [Pseudoduganella aquatica]
MRLLLVEDDPMIGDSIVDGLHGESYAVDWVRNGHDAELAMAAQGYDALLLDLGLPGKEGMDVLHALRTRGVDTPVLIISARDGSAARVAGLDAGADDFLVKPFDLEELLARIRALLRRRVSRSRSVIEHDGLTLDLASHEARFNGAVVKLSAREFALLRVLLDSPGSVVSKRELKEKLYGWNTEVESNTVDVYVHHLRKKFGADFIKNVRGVGYKVAAAA